MSELDNYVATNHYTHCGVKWKKDNANAFDDAECPNCLCAVKPDSSLLQDEDGPIRFFHSSMLLMTPQGGGVLSSAMDITVDGLNALATLHMNEEGVSIEGDKHIHPDFAQAFNAYCKANGHSEIAGYVVVRANEKGLPEFLQAGNPTLYHTEYVASAVISDLENSGIPHSGYEVELIVYRPSDHQICFAELGVMANEALDTSF